MYNIFINNFLKQKCLAKNVEYIERLNRGLEHLESHFREVIKFGITSKVNLDIKTLLKYIFHKRKNFMIIVKKLILILKIIIIN